VTRVKALLIGGTGVIGLGIVKHLLMRDADVTVYSRGLRAHALPPSAKKIQGDRAQRTDFAEAFSRSRYDVVIDMTCFTAEDAASTVRAFGGRCAHLEFCSTVCVYDPRVPPRVMVDEECPREPTSRYGRDKLACERIFERAHEQRLFELTILRPSHTFGPGAPLIDQLELEGLAWDRIARGRQILCAGDGMGLWQSTHRDDCGKLFAYAALNPRTFGQAYNATCDTVFTWRDYHRLGAAALGTRATLVFAPASWIVQSSPSRFRFLAETSRFHGAYSSSKAKSDVPEFRATVAFEDGARETFADMRARGAWPDSSRDDEYERLVERAIDLGFEAVEA
jgi:nucleoside-diphosphate-sugar epimerase